jgi:protein-disulfide isomerase
MTTRSIKPSPSKSSASEGRATSPNVLAHQDDPHLWQRAERLDLDLDRFEADRRSEAVAARVRRDFTSGIRAGVTSTPAAFLGAEPAAGDVVEALRSLARIE